MSDRLSSKDLARLFWAALACTLVVGCQDGSGPSLVTSPDPKTGAEGPPPQPPPPADPAIAFVVDPGPRSGWELRVANADGSNVSTIHSSASLPIQPSWSPDGRSIAFSTNGDIWVIDVVLVSGVPTGTNARVLLAQTPGTNLNYPGWSPLGDEIAFGRGQDDGSCCSTLELVPATGGTSDVVHTTPPGVGVLWPTWNPDATEIAFVSGGLIWAVDIATRTAEVLFSPPAYPEALDWGRTGDMLAFSSFTGNQVGVYTLEISTEILTRVADGRRPTWSPNDTEILFENQSGKLAKVNLATGNVTNLRIGGGSPDWRRF